MAGGQRHSWRWAGAHRALHGWRAKCGDEQLSQHHRAHQHAFWLLDDGQRQRSASEQRAALASTELAVGEPHAVTAEILRGLAEAEIALGQPAQARSHAERARSILIGLYGDADGLLASVRETLTKLDSGDVAPVAAIRAAETK